MLSGSKQIAEEPLGMHIFTTTLKPKDQKHSRSTAWNKKHKKYTEKKTILAWTSQFWFEKPFSPNNLSPERGRIETTNNYSRPNVLFGFANLICFRITSRD